MVYCVTDWIPLGGKVCLLKLRLKKELLCILQVYAPNAKAHYQPFLDEVGVALQKVTSAESIVLLVDFNVYVSTDNRYGRVLSEDKETLTLTETKYVCLLRFCATNGLCVMSAFFQHKRIYKYT